jgi:hypothetical protein
MRLVLAKRVIFDPVRSELGRRHLGDMACMLGEAVRVRRPIRLHDAGEVRHGVGLDAHALIAELLALDEHRAGPAERIQDALALGDAEPAEIVAHQMGRKREHKAVPLMNRAILRVELVDLVVHSPLASGGVAHRGVT